MVLSHALVGAIASSGAPWFAGSASGGTESTSGGYKRHVFTSSGTLSISSGSGQVEVLVVAGGGGGASRGGGAGGAGGYRITETGRSGQY